MGKTIKYIYGITARRRIFYIGQTNDLIRRLSEHLTDDSDSVHGTYIRECLSNQYDLNFVILETVVGEQEDFNKAEEKWITIFLTNGHELTNTATPVYNTISEIKQERHIDRFNLDMSETEIRTKIYMIVYDIAGLYKFGNITFIIKNNGELLDSINVLSEYQLKQFLIKLESEVRTKRDRAVFKLIKTVTKSNMTYLHYSSVFELIDISVIRNVLAQCTFDLFIKNVSCHFMFGDSSETKYELFMEYANYFDLFTDTTLTFFEGKLRELKLQTI